MKRILTVLLCLMLSLTMLFSAAAFAEGGPGGTPPGDPPSGDRGTPPDGAPGGTPPDGAPGGGFGGGTPPGGSTSSFEYAAATEITEAAELTDQTYASETVDESALIVNTADAVTITNPTVSKTGSSNGGDNCNFYGLNAALLVMGGSTATITGGAIESSASSANGVFSCGGNSGRNGAAVN